MLCTTCPLAYTTQLFCDPSLIGREGRPELTMVGLLPPIADVELEEDEGMDITGGQCRGGCKVIRTLTTLQPMTPTF